MRNINPAILLICVIILCVKMAAMNEIQFDRAELDPMYIENFYNASIFRVSKFNRTTYGFNAEGDLYADVDENVEIEVSFYYNRFNNNQYSKTPIHVPRSNICAVAEKYYREFAMEELKNKSNFPQYEPPEKFCPLKKV